MFHSIIIFTAVSKCFTANMSKVGHEVCETTINNTNPTKRTKTNVHTL